MRRLNVFERVLVAMLLFFDMSYCMAQKLPGDAAQLLPTLDTEISTYWPDLSPRAYPALIIYQESRWKTKAKLQTSRELGCGLSQMTIAYNADGSVRFDALAETRRLDPSLKDWNWKDCYNVQYQLRGMLLKLKVNDRNCMALMRDNREVKACASASYNSGYGGVGKRIRSCRMQKGCDPELWFGNLELQCAATAKVAGYGESFCQISSKYPGRVESGQYLFRGFWPKDPVLSEWPRKK